MTLRVTEDGQWVSAEAQRIAQVIHDYDERLRLSWIPPGARTEPQDHEFPYAIMFDNPNGTEELVFRFREKELDHRIIARLWDSDGKNGNVLTKIEAEEAARRAVEMLKQEDDAEERRELAAWMIKAKPGTKMGNGVVLT